MNTAEKVCASIGMALIISALFTALYYYIYKEQMKELCIMMGGNYTETSNFWFEKTSCNITQSSITIIRTTTSQDIIICPDNQTYMEIICDCAKTDSEYYKKYNAICLAKCYECIG